MEGRGVVVAGVVPRVTASVFAVCGVDEIQAGPFDRADSAVEMRELYKPAQGCCAILMSVLQASKGTKEYLQGLLAPNDFLKLFQMQPLPTKIGSLVIFQIRTWRYGAQAQYSLY